MFGAVNSDYTGDTTHQKSVTGTWNGNNLLSNKIPR
jgi:hypothetical protein